MEIPALGLTDLLDLIGTLATVIALIFATRSFTRNNRIQEATFIKDVFETFHRDRQMILTNPSILEVLVKQQKRSPELIIQDSLGSFDINRAYLIHYLHQQKLLPANRRDQDIKDIALLFTDEMVQKRWQVIRSFYPQDFQTFIDQEILPKKEVPKIHIDATATHSHDSELCKLQLPDHLQG